MPDFILDVQGLEKTFKTPDGVIDAVNRVSSRLDEGKTPGVVGESGNPVLATGMIGVEDDCTMFYIASYATRPLFKRA